MLEKENRRMGDWTGSLYSFCPRCGGRLHYWEVDCEDVRLRCYRCWPVEKESPEEEIKRLRRKLGERKKALREANKGCARAVDLQALVLKDLVMARHKLYETQIELQEGKREIKRLNNLLHGSNLENP